jgi:hypothetical protein
MFFFYFPCLCPPRHVGVAYGPAMLDHVREFNHDGDGEEESQNKLIVVMRSC